MGKGSKSRHRGTIEIASLAIVRCFNRWEITLSSHTLALVASRHLTNPIHSPTFREQFRMTCCKSRTTPSKILLARLWSPTLFAGYCVGSLCESPICNSLDNNCHRYQYDQSLNHHDSSEPMPNHEMPYSHFSTLHIP